MPFQYQPRVNPYVGSITDLMGRGTEARSLAELSAAEAEARGQLRLGDITQQKWSGLGQTIGQGIDDYVTEQREAPIREQEARLRGLKIRSAEEGLAQGERTLEDKISQAAMDTEALELLKVHLAEGGQFDEALRRKFILTFGPVEGAARLEPLEASFTAYTEDTAARTAARGEATDLAYRDMVAQGAASGELTPDNLARMEYREGRGDSPFPAPPPSAPNPTKASLALLAASGDTDAQAAFKMLRDPAAPSYIWVRRNGQTLRILQSDYDPATDRHITAKDEEEPPSPLVEPVPIPEDETLWNSLGWMTTGPFSVIGSSVSEVTGGMSYVTENKQRFNNAQNSMLDALALNRRFSNAEILRIKSNINIDPNFWSSRSAIRTRMREIDRFLQTQEGLRLKDGDTDAVNAFRQFRNRMGVPPLIVEKVEMIAPVRRGEVVGRTMMVPIDEVEDYEILGARVKGAN
jgi:hypothetical protein